MLGTAYGVYGRAESDGGVGVAGLAPNTYGVTYGGWFETNSTYGTGVYGYAGGPT